MNKEQTQSTLPSPQKYTRTKVDVLVRSTSEVEKKINPAVMVLE